METERLTLRRPDAGDVAGIFDRYASDPEATRYVIWPRHTTLEDTRAFLAFSDAEWTQWGCGPLLVFSRANGALLGGTGLGFEAQHSATTGYIFAPDAWGMGYATEALHAMVELASGMRVTRLHATCHVENHASRRVMEKCGFEREGLLARQTVFPNLSPDPCDVLSYACLF